MYDLKKSIWKGVKAVLIFIIPVGIAYLNATGVGDQKIIDLIIKSFPILGSLTVAGLLTLALDWLKHKDDGK